MGGMRAPQQVGRGDPGLVRDTLRATLVKNRDAIGTFPRLFGHQDATE